MIKKLRNFIVNPDGKLQTQGKKVTVNHLIPVAQGEMTKLNWKHIKLTSQTKMSVKRAVAVCSLDVASDIHPPLPPEDTVETHTYLKQCHKLFQIFNKNSEVDLTCYKQLLSIMTWFDKWYGEVKQNSWEATIGLKDHWKQFIPHITYQRPCAKMMLKISFLYHYSGQG